MRQRSIFGAPAPASYVGTLRVVGAGESGPANSHPSTVHGIITFGTRQRVQREEGVEGRGGPKIAFVGGGSYQWGPKIILDVALNERLRGGTLVLHDISAEALDDMFDWRRKAIERATADLKLEKTLVLEEALRGADFVVLSISTGGLDATALDLEIPARYGVVQTVGDTVGPGGLFRGLRNIPVVVEIARAMERFCPEAVLLNLTNPLTILTRAVTMATSIRAIGLCHELFSTLGMLSKMFEAPEEAINVRVAGINHFIWVTEVSVHGRDVTGEAFRRIAGGEAREISLSDTDGNTDPFVNTWGIRTELCTLYGYLPAAGDRHVCEFLPGYLQDEKERERLDLRVTTVDVRRDRLAQDREMVRRMIRDDEPIPTRRSREEISDIIAAMWTGEDSVNIVNLPNAGQIRDLPFGAVVETYGALNGAGASGIVFGELPPPVAALVHSHVFNQEAIVLAGLTEETDLAFRAFLNDPLVGNRADARDMFDEMLEAQRGYLPHVAS
jgi:alpha-galactosidase/6-phospho-beta-glucosidase family protein